MSGQPHLLAWGQAPGERALEAYLSAFILCPLPSSRNDGMITINKLLALFFPLDGLRTFFVTLRVDLHEPLREVDFKPEQGPIPELVGFYQNFGVTAESPPEALQMALQEIEMNSPSGSLNLSETEVKEVKVYQLDPTIQRKAAGWRRRTVWYRSGRAFFWKEDEFR